MRDVGAGRAVAPRAVPAGARRLDAADLGAPVDILETEREVLVLVALPGVNPDRVEASIEEGHLIIAGVRVLPPELQTAVIHRLELPQGRFERRVRLPAGRYRDVRHCAVNGCLAITLQKMEPVLG